jgi:hypothetical protein
MELAADRVEVGHWDPQHCRHAELLQRFGVVSRPQPNAA